MTTPDNTADPAETGTTEGMGVLPAKFAHKLTCKFYKKILAKDRNTGKTFVTSQSLPVYTPQTRIRN